MLIVLQGSMPKQDYYYNPTVMQQSGNGQNAGGMNQQSPSMPQPATPQTPGSIPEIILSGK